MWGRTRVSALHNSPTEALQESRQFRRQWRGERQRLAGPRVLELQHCGMEKISGEGEADSLFAAKLTRGAVQRVTHDGMAQRCEVNSNLVGPACVDLHFQQREFSILRIQLALDRVVGYGFASPRA